MKDINNINNIIHNIAEEIIKKNNFSNNIGVLGGNSGIIIFLFHYAFTFKKEKYSIFANEKLHEMIDIINTGNIITTFCNGLAGAIWSIDYLVNNNYIDFNCDKEFLNIEDYLFECMNNDNKINNYDFLHGSLGYGFYFLERYKNTNDYNLKKKYSFFISTLINSLNESYNRYQESIFWKSYNSLTSDLYVNFGLAHGIPSIISFLSKTIELKIVNNNALFLLKKSIDFLFLFKNESNISTYPSFFKIDNKYNFEEGPTYSRLAWCYGDLGISIALFNANKVLKDNYVKKEYLNLVNKSAKRILLPETTIVDAGVCHGSFGLALMYDFFYKQKKDKNIKEAVNFWVKDGINKAIYTDGAAGFKSYKGKDNLTNEFNILDGISGIGMSLLSVISSNKQEWSKCLLIN